MCETYIDLLFVGDDFGYRRWRGERIFDDFINRSRVILITDLGFYVAFFSRGFIGQFST